MSIYPKKALDKLKTDADRQARLFEKRIQFVGEPYAPSAGIKLQAITIQCTSDQFVRILASEVKQIKVVIDVFGTATGKKLKSADGKIVGAIDASIIVPVVEGEAEVIFEAATTGTWRLSLDPSVDARAAELNTADLGNGTFS